MLKLISNDCKAHRCPAIPAYRRHRQRSVGLGIPKIFLTRSQRVDPLRFVRQIRRCNPAMCRAWQGVRRDSDGLTRVQADDEILKYVDDNSHSFLKEGPPLMNESTNTDHQGTQSMQWCAIGGSATGREQPCYGWPFKSEWGTSRCNCSTCFCNCSIRLFCSSSRSFSS